MATNQLLDNRYQIINKLQETHVSITFQGQDTRRFNRLCLIKQLKTSYDPQLQQQLEKRFQQEAEILERLGRHPQIPDLYDCFSENNQLYLVQEWIAGFNLQQKFQQEGKLTETEVKDILIKLLPVLEFLQENQIIHRDIKPNNIMLNGENLPILIDFGIVKEIYTIVNPNKANTVMGIGTPGFVSREQIKGQPTHASDIYSLGITAIYLLTGKIPDAKFSWRQDVPNISPEFADILDKSIEENLSDRYQTATEMLTAIKNIKTSYSPNTKQQIPRTQPSLDPNQKVSPVTLTNPGNSQWLKIGIVAIIVGIISTATAIFYNNKAEQPMVQLDRPPIEIPTPKPPVDPTPIEIPTPKPIDPKIRRTPDITWTPKTTPYPSKVILQEEGILSDDDWVLPSDNSIYAEHTFEGTNGQVVNVTLESSDFDTYLAVFSPTHQLLGEDDDINQKNTNSQLTVTLPVTGRYRVIVNSYDKAGRGKYNLRVVRVE
ncbi:protein kinase [Okeania sp. SIO2B3]|uniref:protein kinase domain-containing protein n=1 Tax=Okeania sp. SIO2B3 TaxID=2607784 RepID=UPI0013C109FC|nr:protein kinase [Okeania sp. SIO2B3]NET46456.1 protein kinase [Okeania sp. SIO2B3]